MPLIRDAIALREKFAALPTATYQAGEIVVAAGSRTGQLMILKKGAVAFVKNDIEIARVSEPGTVFGELSCLLDQPLRADVRALENSEFHVANRTALLAQDLHALSDIAPILAKRIDVANQILVDLRSQLNAGPLERDWTDFNEESSNSTGASLVYAGYPYDPTHCVISCHIKSTPFVYC